MIALGLSAKTNHLKDLWCVQGACGFRRARSIGFKTDIRFGRVYEDM
jgi:hypothetical protein